MVLSTYDSRRSSLSLLLDALACTRIASASTHSKASHLEHSNVHEIGEKRIFASSHLSADGTQVYMPLQKLIVKQGKQSLLSIPNTLEI